MSELKNLESNSQNDKKTLSAKIKIKKFGGKQKFLSPQRIFDMFTFVDTILQYKAL